jgi:hypothetical protein
MNWRDNPTSDLETSGAHAEAQTRSQSGTRAQHRGQPGSDLRSPATTEESGVETSIERTSTVAADGSLDSHSRKPL